MRARARSRVEVDLIGTAEELGELAKLGQKLGRDTLITQSNEERVPGPNVVLTNRDDLFLSEEIAMLVAVECVTQDVSLAHVLADVERQLKDILFPVDKKPSDARAIGSGHVDDE